MKQIILMRHADANKSASINDFAAPLTSMGETQANAAAEFLMNFNIDKVLLSPTKRTTETLSIILRQYDIKNIEQVRAIYEGSENKMMEIITQQPSNVNSLMIIGHNPTITTIVTNLAEHSSKEYDHISTTTMSTAQIVVIVLQDLNSWQDIQKSYAAGVITHIFNPNLDD